MLALGSASADVRRLNQRWEADSTKADIMCSDGRCVLIGIIDVWSRRLKLLVSPTSKSTAVAALLRRCIIDWGVPEEFRTDNGADYTAFAMERLLFNLDIAHHLCAPFSPEQKPHIERVFGTFSRGLLELLPGYIGHSVADRKQIESRMSFAKRFGKKGEVVEIAMSSAELQKFCDEWTDHHYHQDVHSTLKMTPAAKARSWTEPVKRISDERVLDLLLYAAPAGDGYRTIGKKGVEVTFQGVKLQFISGSFAGHEGERVLPMIDPACIGTAVIYAADGSFLAVAEDPRFKGISQQEVAEEAKAIQKETLAELKKEVKAAAKKAGTSGIANKIRQQRKEQAEKIAGLPKKSTEHGSAALDQGAIALGEIERKKAAPCGAPITPELLKSADELIRLQPQERPMTETDKYFECNRKVKDGTATDEEKQFIADYDYWENTGKRVGLMAIRRAA